MQEIMGSIFYDLNRYFNLQVYLSIFLTVRVYVTFQRFITLLASDTFRSSVRVGAKGAIATVDFQNNPFPPVDFPKT